MDSTVFCVCVCVSVCIAKGIYEVCWAVIGFGTHAVEESPLVLVERHSQTEHIKSIPAHPLAIAARQQMSRWNFSELSSRRWRECGKFS